MIELNSVVVVFMMEALLALFLLIGTLFLFFRKKTAGEQNISNKVIDKLQDAESVKAQNLSDLITTHCELESDVLDELLVEVKTSERHLYRQIIQMFLDRDIKMLGNISQKIDKLAEPYCKILTHSSGAVAAEKIKETGGEYQLAEENKRLREQLTVAMSTIDEISTEYTQIFGGTQTELELENSSRKMFNIFQQAGQKIKAATTNAGEES